MLSSTSRTKSPIKDNFFLPAVLRQSCNTRVKIVLPKFGGGDQSLEVLLLLRHHVVNVQMDCLLLEHRTERGSTKKKGVNNNNNNNNKYSDSQVEEEQQTGRHLHAVLNSPRHLEG